MDQIMNILFVIPSLTQGGAEKNMIWLANNLSDYHKISFVVLTKKENLQSENLRQNIVFYHQRSLRLQYFSAQDHSQLILIILVPKKLIY